MDFVSKKDFEAAIALIERALKNNQVEEGREKFTLKTLLFGLEGHSEYTTTPKHASFIPADMSLKNRLHLLRQELKMTREGLSDRQKNLEKLEKEEQALVALLPKIKE